MVWVTQIMEIFNSYIRIMLMSLSSVALSIYAMRRVFPVKRKDGVMPLYVFYRVVVIQFLVNGVFREKWAGQEWWSMFMAVVMLANIFIIWFVMYWTFEGPFLQIAKALYLYDLYLSVFGIASICLLNYVEGRQHISSFEGEFQWLDLLLPILMLGMYRILGKIELRIMRKIVFSKSDVSNIFSVLCVLFTLATALTYLPGKQVNEMFHEFVIMPAIGTGVFLILGVWLITVSYKRNLSRENEYLKMRYSLLEAYTMEMNAQLKKIEQYQQKMKQQMVRLENISGYGADEIRKEEYLSDLKAQYTSLTVCKYSSNWMLDAYLCQKDVLYRKKGAEVEFLFQEFAPGNLRQEHWLEVLENLFVTINLALDTVSDNKEKRLFLRASAVKNQLVFHMNCSSSSRLTRHFWNLKRHLKKHDIYLKHEWKKGMLDVTLMLARK